MRQRIGERHYTVLSLLPDSSNGRAVLLQSTNEGSIPSSGTQKGNLKWTQVKPSTDLDRRLACPVESPNKITEHMLPWRKWRDAAGLDPVALTGM